MSKTKTLATIKATNGQPYTITHKGNLYALRRRTTNGYPQSIVMTRTDVIHVCNALIDSIETHATT